MAKITVVGAGYVGLIAAVGFAKCDHRVWCIEINKSRLEGLRQGRLSFYEPGVEELLSLPSLSFSPALRDGLQHSDTVFIAVGTPSLPDGSTDMTAFMSVIDEILSLAEHDLIVVNKSTVPLGTKAKVQSYVDECLKVANKNIRITLISNPEFLREGSALEDFVHPDRVVIGGEDEQAKEKIKSLYRSFVDNEGDILMMDSSSAELSKYACNAMLATRVAFINEISRISRDINADVEQVRRVMITDIRIGEHFLKPSLGYGGACLPKDVDSVCFESIKRGTPLSLLPAIKNSNTQQQEFFLNQLHLHFNRLGSQHSFAVWGVAFKADTDDVRESAALQQVKKILEMGSSVSIYDPQAMSEAKKILVGYDKVEYVDDMYEALNGKDGLLILTEWLEFVKCDWGKVRERLSQAVVFDGRNLFDPIEMSAQGFRYICIGRNV